MEKDYRSLIVWQKSMDLVDEIYRIVKLLPKEELYSLSNQMRRCAVSVPSNIAEGYERGSKKEYAKFLLIARASRAELETQLMVCVRQGFVDEKEVEKAFSLCVEIRKMLTSILSKL